MKKQQLRREISETVTSKKYVAIIGFMEPNNYLASNLCHYDEPSGGATATEIEERVAELIEKRRVGMVIVAEKPREYRASVKVAR